MQTMRKQHVTKVKGGNKLTKEMFIPQHLETCRALPLKKYDNKKHHFAIHSLAYSRRKCAKNIWRSIMKRRNSKELFDSSNSLKNSNSSSDSNSSNNSKGGGNLPLPFEDKFDAIADTIPSYEEDIETREMESALEDIKELFRITLAQERAVTEQRMIEKLGQIIYKTDKIFRDQNYSAEEYRANFISEVLLSINQAINERKEIK